ncbi:MAG: hypothetical protein KatS3mg019_1233 [Fimbriimonadales bacterium]|nr:MAG: hypothetical protein KatS3mg019_1233 [Fimbriimonadales bacterium]
MPQIPENVERCWITVVGWSPMAVVNTIWAACEQGVVPQRVVLLASPDEPAVQRSVQIVKQHLRALLPLFDVPNPAIMQRPIDEDDLLGFRRTLAQVLEAERKHAEKLVLDTTAGRKYMSAFGLAQGRRTDLKLEKVYYNHLLSQRYIDSPYPLIPRHEQRLYDLKAMLDE